MRKLLALLFAGFLFVPMAACGDDDGGDDTSSSASGSGSGSAAEDEDDEGGDNADSDFCQQADTIANDDSLEALDFEDPDDVETALGILDEFRDNAPDEIKDDLGTLIDAFQAFVDAGDDPEALQELEEQFADFDEVSTRIEDFVEEECGVDLSGDGTASTDDTTDTTESSDGDEEAGDPADPPDIDDPELAELAEQCHDGSGEACDQLFFQSDVGTPEEDYGDTCGGRFDESPGLCATAIGE